MDSGAAAGAAGGDAGGGGGGGAPALTQDDLHKAAEKARMEERAKVNETITGGPHGCQYFRQGHDLQGQ